MLAWRATGLTWLSFTRTTKGDIFWESKVMELYINPQNLFVSVTVCAKVFLKKWDGIFTESGQQIGSDTEIVRLINLSSE